MKVNKKEYRKATLKLRIIQGVEGLSSVTFHHPNLLLSYLVLNVTLQNYNILLKAQKQFMTSTSTVYNVRQEGNNIPENRPTQI